MKRKKIIIFTAILIMIIGGIVLLRNIFVVKGETLENVVYKSENLIIHVAKEGEEESKRLVILGSGYSLSIDEENRIESHDPLMIFPSMKQYSKGTTVMSIYYPFQSRGLEEAGRELSNFINSELNEYDEITLIGHSKCGVCFANASKWIDRKVAIVTISAPFYGTPSADEKLISEKLNFIERVAYSMIFSNHNVDKDIMPNSRFMKRVDYSGLENHWHINVVSTCPQKTFNPIEILLKYMDKRVEIFGDGIVPKESQEKSFPNTTSREIKATHATSLEKGIEVIKKYVFIKPTINNLPFDL